MTFDPEGLYLLIFTQASSSCPNQPQQHLRAGYVLLFYFCRHCDQHGSHLLGGKNPDSVPPVRLLLFWEETTLKIATLQKYPNLKDTILRHVSSCHSSSKRNSKYHVVYQIYTKPLKPVSGKLDFKTNRIPTLFFSKGNLPVETNKNQLRSDF